MNQEEYIKIRVDSQIGWYSKKSVKNKMYHHLTTLAVIVFGASIPFLVGLEKTNTINFTILVGILGVLIALITGVSTLWNFQEKWTEYRIAAEALKREKYLFSTKSLPYQDESDAYQKFVIRVEDIISRENAAWKEVAKAKDA